MYTFRQVEELSAIPVSENKDQLNKGTKNYIACKLCTTNLRSSKNYILQTKALMWNEGFPGNFFLRIKPNAHTPKACKARTTYSY